MTHGGTKLASSETYALEEKGIQDALAAANVDKIVETMWPHHSPQQIAGFIRVQAKRRFPWITPRWVEGVKRRIDTKRRAGATMTSGTEAGT